jgi:hypothetical protein
VEVSRRAGRGGGGVARRVAQLAVHEGLLLDRVRRRRPERGRVEAEVRSAEGGRFGRSAHGMRSPPMAPGVRPEGSSISR